jgi:GNAT superfamily N-acetyltransferase
MYRKPAPLSERHHLEGFDSGKSVLDTFLKEMALHNQAQGYTRTFVIADADFRVVGYHSLCAGMISRENAPRQIKGHQAPGEIPVALLARLAVDRRQHGQGLGGELLKNALLAVVATSEVVAFRAVMVHALDDEAASFYLRYGFRQAKGLDRTLLLPVKDIVASVGN